MIMGVGSVTDAASASRFMALGANFIVTPVLREDTVWLVLKGALKGGWYRVNERDSLMSADSARVRTLETLRAEASRSFVGKMAAEMEAKNEKKKVRAEEEIATQNRLNSEKEVAQQQRR